VAFPPRLFKTGSMLSFRFEGQKQNNRSDGVGSGIVTVAHA